MLRKYLIALCSISLLCAHIEATQVAKGFHSCNHAVYGQAQKIMIGRTSGGTDLEYVARENLPYEVFTVPVTISGAHKNIAFNSNTSTFKIKHTGPYRIDYYAKLFSLEDSDDQSHTDCAFVGIKVNGKIVATRSLDPKRARDYQILEGGAHILIHLKKRDKVTLFLDTTGVDAAKQVCFANTMHSSYHPDVAASITISKPHRTY